MRNLIVSIQTKKSTLDTTIHFTDVLKIIKTELLPIYEALDNEF